MAALPDKGLASQPPYGLMVWPVLIANVWNHW